MNASSNRIELRVSGIHRVPFPNIDNETWSRFLARHRNSVCMRSDTLIIHCREHRSLSANKTGCIDKVRHMIANSSFVEPRAEIIPPKSENRKQKIVTKKKFKGTKMLAKIARSLS